jgi:hypothetical protein
MTDDTELAIQRRQRGTDGLALFSTNPVDGTTQNGRILAHLQAGHGLTALDALNLFGCNRLAARVADLKAAGYVIRSDMVTLPNGKRVARYRLDAQT